MGALGWSDGAGVSSVVCAHALTVKLLASANVKIAIPNRNLFFINIFSESITSNPHVRGISRSKRSNCHAKGRTQALN
jgi:hypothetical protein